MLYFECQQLAVRGRADICPKVDFSRLTIEAKSFYRQREQREGAHAETTQSVLTVVLKF